jgi:hypothetical protein
LQNDHRRQIRNSRFEQNEQFVGSLLARVFQHKT